MLHRFAVGHQMGDVDDGSETEVLSPWAIPRGMNAAGGISCHIQDLLRYGAYHLGDGSPLLRRDSLKQMHSPQVGINNYMGSVGLSWILNTIDGSRLLGHGGGTNGQNAILSVAPEHDLVLGMMTNGDLGGKLNDRFRKAVLREFCGIEVPEPQVIESSKDELAQYVGTYSGTIQEIELRLDGGSLRAYTRTTGDLPFDSPVPEPELSSVARCGTDQLLVLEGDNQDARADIIRDEKGAIRYLRFGSRVHVKQ